MFPGSPNNRYTGKRSREWHAPSISKCRTATLGKFIIMAIATVGIAYTEWDYKKHRHIHHDIHPSSSHYCCGTMANAAGTFHLNS
eukprot:9890768-Karenia_brevis.AAC.1